MVPIYSAPITTGFGEKSISVYNCNILNFDQQIDILTTSAVSYHYKPTPRSIFHALLQVGISVEQIATDPEIDLRRFCHVWLSKELHSSHKYIRRIGCIEALYNYQQASIHQESLLTSIKAYFQMLDIAATYGIKMNTIALPLLGTGKQQLPISLIMIPILNECVSFLKRNAFAKQILFVEMNPEKAALIAASLQNSYLLSQVTPRSQIPKATQPPRAMAFISYSSPDKNIADNLCSKLERENVKVWYAPRDVKGPYATAIANAIGNATHFIVILSRNSMQSEHVLNEIDLAFQKLPSHIKFKPLRIDESLFTPSFQYYLSRQHWMDALIPPLEDRLNEFVKAFLADL